MRMRLFTRKPRIKASHALENLFSTYPEMAILVDFVVRRKF